MCCLDVLYSETSQNVKRIKIRMTTSFQNVRVVEDDIWFTFFKSTHVHYEGYSFIKPLFQESIEIWRLSITEENRVNDRTFPPLIDVIDSRNPVKTTLHEKNNHYDRWTTAVISVNSCSKSITWSIWRIHTFLSIPCFAFSSAWIHNKYKMMLTMRELIIPFTSMKQRRRMLLNKGRNIYMCGLFVVHTTVLLYDFLCKCIEIGRQKQSVILQSLIL